MYTPTLLTDLLYVQYLHAIWLSSKNDLPILTLFLWSIHIYICQSRDCCVFSLVTILGNMYNLCELHSLICMCSDMHSSCYSLSDCTFLYKYGYETKLTEFFTAEMEKRSKVGAKLYCQHRRRQCFNVICYLPCMKKKNTEV